MLGRFLVFLREFFTRTSSSPTSAAENARVRRALVETWKPAGSFVSRISFSRPQSALPADAGSLPQSPLRVERENSSRKAPSIGARSTPRVRPLLNILSYLAGLVDFFPFLPFVGFACTAYRNIVHVRFIRWLFLRVAAPLEKTSSMTSSASTRPLVVL
ncbi:hypothetical protein TGARI_305130 [Toxoplasma gondii ARI]|uniref:Transmembrane protein n=1 Tax=Toxoplasma gondii ARI TaxID=1074872 RepID=A0A139Y166_TOXGO|nr:hypothetical protein TGARI_305130 [Toxoplasma gondii ARI]